MKVIVVDDAQPTLRIFDKLLRQLEGLTVYTFTSSRDALEFAEQQPVDLLIADYRMPDLNGVELIERLRLRVEYAETPMLMITSERDNEIRRRAVELGVSDFLSKPADPVEFLARVRNLLALRASRKKLADRALQLAEEVRAATMEITLREQETIHRLTRAAEFRDNETGMHIVRMGRFAAILGREIGLDRREQELLLLAAPMHDIGKVATPDDILLKPAKLTPEEMRVMREHTIAGFEILRDSKSPLLQKGAEIALSHHEKWDGSGYPYGLAGDAIPLSGRICALADVFDALTSVRPYKPAWPVERAVAHIHGSAGTHFDPALVAAFERVLPEIREIRIEFADREAVPA